MDRINKIKAKSNRWTLQKTYFRQRGQFAFCSFAYLLVLI